mgnify:CR=1 FL=1
MQEKDFVSYEYRTKTVKAKDHTKAMDMYEAFGWEVTSTTPAIADGTLCPNVLTLLRQKRRTCIVEIALEEYTRHYIVQALFKLMAAESHGYVRGVRLGSNFYNARNCGRRNAVA